MTSVADRLGLNDAQREALGLVRTGPLRVIAGPGTGKTTTVVAMYVHLLEEAGLRPGEVLLLTFANNAAEQLKSRIDEHVRGSYDKSWVSTFHSFATRVLTRWGPANGIPPFTLMNSFQEKLLMRRVLAGMNDVSLGGFASLRTSDALVQDALWFVGILKQNLVRSDHFLAQVAGSDRPRLVDLAAIYRAYWLLQDQQRLWDFRDVIAQCHNLLVENHALRTELSTTFRHVIVDEYQDVNSAQVSLLRQLVSAHEPATRLAVVGDPNQSIYGFRGTLPAHIGDAWPFGGELVRLTDSYRSYEQVLDAAGALLERWDTRPQGLRSTRGRAPIEVIAVDAERTASDEATAVARQVRQLIDGGVYAPSEIAVILRSLRRSGRLIEEALRGIGIPVASAGSPGFAASDVVRFCVSALRALAQPASDDHVVDLLDSPFVGVPPADSRRVVEEAERRRTAGGDPLRTTSLLTVLTHACFLLADEDPERWPLPWDRPGVTAPSGESREALAAQESDANAVADAESARSAPRRVAGAFVAELSDPGRDAIHLFTWTWGRLVALTPRVAPHALLGELIDALGVLRTALDPGLDATRRSEVAGPLRLMTAALADLDTFTERLDGRPAALADVVDILDQVLPEYVDELEAPNAGEPGVRLLTVHASKGLEFPVVFLPALAAQRFPVVARARTPLLGSADQAWIEAALGGFAAPWPANDAAFLAEEARLGYVAETRARDVLRVSWAAEYERGEPAAPSAFLEPLIAAGALTRQDTELHRMPPGRSSSLPLSEHEATAVAAWTAWSQPVAFLDETTDSATSVSRYLQCPRKYFYYKALGLATDSGQAARRGSAFHTVMEHFHAPACEAEWRPALPDLAVAQRLYAQIADGELGRYLRGVNGVVRRQSERKALTSLLSNYFDNESAYWQESVTLTTERGFRWTPLAGVTLVGYVDRVLRYDNDGIVEIVDFKTGRGRTAGEVRNMLGMSEDTPASDFQLLIYLGAARAGAIEGVDAERVEVVGLWYPRETFKRPPGIRKLRVVRSEEAASRLPHDTTAGNRVILDAAAEAERAAALRSTLTAMREGRFAPEPTLLTATCLATWTGGCEFEWVCPGRITEPPGFVAE